MTDAAAQGGGGTVSVPAEVRIPAGLSSRLQEAARARSVSVRFLVGVAVFDLLERIEPTTDSVQITNELVAEDPEPDEPEEAPRVISRDHSIGPSQQEFIDHVAHLLEDGAEYVTATDLARGSALDGSTIRTWLHQAYELGVFDRDRIGRGYRYRLPAPPDPEPERAVTPREPEPEPARDPAREPEGSDDVEARIVELAKQGLTRPAISKETGVGKNRISRVLKDAGVSTKEAALEKARRGTPKRQEVVKLVEEGMSVAEVAKRLDISEQGVYYHLRKAKAPPPSERHQEEVEDRRKKYQTRKGHGRVVVRCRNCGERGATNSRLVGKSRKIALCADCQKLEGVA